MFEYNAANTVKFDNSELSKAVQEQLQLQNLSYTEEILKKSYRSFYNRYVKRWIGFPLALIIVIVLLPVYIIIGLCVALESGFPVLYRAERGGYKGKPFKICKFRTMVKNADKIGGGTTAFGDKRITKVGAFLRKTKLDEIAQLFNVLGGSMSFVGPRPELLRYVNQYEGLDKNILNVRPGITDFSSLYLINLDEIVGAENADEMYEKYVLKKKNQLRLQYVAEVSFRTDVKLFFYTVFRVFKKAFRVLFRKKNESDKMVESVK